MPKMKPHTGMGKRVKVTGTGKIVSRAGRHAPPAGGQVLPRTRRLTGTVEISKVDTKRIKKLLGR